MGLSVTVITKNEELNVARCLDSVNWADEIIVVDCGSTDRTMEIASGYTDKLYTREFTGFSDQKNYALSLATQDWVLNIDADEELSPGLQTEILKVINSGTTASGFWIPRLTYYLGKPIRHCGWYPDYQLRLFLKNGSHYPERKVHERISVNGYCDHLKGDLLHYSYESFRHHIEKQSAYAIAGADQLDINGKKISLVKLAICPIFGFFKKYVLQQGFLDGVRGFLISAMYTNYVFVKYAESWDQQRRRTGETNRTEKGH